ncbi:MAG: type II secretion system protein [Verrucomicrobiae bacterium]|nr:type II secretion system protein [Verrucomicrobiae bacterium]
MTLSTQHSALSTQRGGFTLLEVMIAVVILGTAMLVLMEGLAGSLNAVDSIRNTNTATELLTIKLAELQQQEDLSEGSEEGDFEETQPGFSWQTEIALSPDLVDLYNVKITVSWTERGQRASDSIETYIYRASDAPKTFGSITRKAGQPAQPGVRPQR